AGRGLWEGTDVEFRGAAFPIGGDATIDGLVTIPNILLEFNEQLAGVSHGMGKRSRLPDYQLNVAESNTETDDLPEQATELVRRLHSFMSLSELREKWTLLTIATGTEEFCNRCDTPNHASIRRALGIIRKGIPKAFVVLLGPVHVASSYKLHINLLSPRCRCLESISMKKYRMLVGRWREIFVKVQNEFNSLKHATFGVLAIPRLPIHSREPESLLVPGKTLLNRKGHAYAAKWMWNRLMAGPSYNFSNSIFSQDSYYCPSVGCPYFRTVQNMERCSVISQSDYQRLHATTRASVNGTVRVPHRVKVRNNLVEIIALVVLLSLISVSILGAFFYYRSKKATMGRFQTVPEEGSEQKA
ncbi:Phospholipase B1 membrane-associated, partial [Trichostrongylus colubriformis]